MTSFRLRPDAGRWQNKVFTDFRIYAVTDVINPGLAFLKTVESVYKNGVDILQLRSKTLSMSEKIKLGHAIRKVSSRLRKLYFVNDSLDLALITNADGLHVGQDDIAPRDVRSLCKKIGRQLYLGLSTHSESQARAALKQPVDYFGVGPVFETPTKPDYGSVGLKLVTRVKGFATKPWVAIGGIDEKNISQVIRAGASRVALVRAIFNSPNPGLAASGLTLQMKGN